MANDLLTIDMITREALRILHNNLGFTKTVRREYQDQFAKDGAKIGTVLRIRKPAQYTVTSGTYLSAALSAQDTDEDYVSLTVQTQKHIDVNFTSGELTMQLDDFSKRILAPAMSRLAGEIDKDGLALALDVAQSVGTPGTTPATALVWLQGGQKLNENAVPLSDRYACMNPAANAATVNGLTGLFHAQGAIENQYRKGMMGRNVLGYDEMFMAQNVPALTTGARASYQTNLVSGWTAEGTASLAVDTGTGAIAAGEVFTIAGVYACNPETKISTGSLKQFVVTAAHAGGAGNLSIDPPIWTSDATAAEGLAKQNVAVASGAGVWDNAALTFIGTASTAYPQNLVYHEEAFTLATVDLEIPRGVDMARRAQFDGISLRIVRQYDINNDKFPCRIDVLYGWKTLRPEFACRVWG